MMTGSGNRGVERESNNIYAKLERMKQEGSFGFLRGMRFERFVTVIIVVRSRSHTNTLEYYGYRCHQFDGKN